MHGADRDIVWLQRDFGIYLCNMFDTGQVLYLETVFEIWDVIDDFVWFFVQWLNLNFSSYLLFFGV